MYHNQLKVQDLPIIAGNLNINHSIIAVYFSINWILNTTFLKLTVTLSILIIYFVRIILISGKFDNLGLAEGIVPRSLGAIKEIRLTVHSETDNWAILSEVS